MESDILNELTTIRWLLTAVLLIFLLVLAAAIVFAASMKKLVRTRVTKDDRIDFTTEVERYEDLGDYEKMAEECQLRLEEYPADVWARFKLAIAFSKGGKPGLALESLARVKEIDPAWERDFVDKYIDKVRASMEGPTP